MSFLGRVVADAQRRGAGAGNVRAMPAAASAAEPSMGTAADGPLDSPFAIDAVAFGAGDAAHGDRLPLQPAQAPSSRAPEIGGQVRWPATDRAPAAVTEANPIAPSASLAGRVTGNPAGADLAPQDAATPLTHSARAQVGGASRRENADGRDMRVDVDARGHPASGGAASDAALDPPNEHERSAFPGATERPDIDAQAPGGRPNARAQSRGRGRQGDAADAVRVEASAAGARGMPAASPRAREVIDAPASAPQEIRQAAADVDAQAARQQRMQPIDVVPVQPAPSLRSTAAPPRGMPQPPPQLQRSAPTVRIDHVDIVVTDPPSRPGRRVQERPGNPASRNYLRRL